MNYLYYVWLALFNWLWLSNFMAVYPGYAMVIDIYNMFPHAGS